MAKYAPTTESASTQHAHVATYAGREPFQRPHAAQRSKTSKYCFHCKFQNVLQVVVSTSAQHRFKPRSAVQEIRSYLHTELQSHCWLNRPRAHCMAWLRRRKTSVANVCHQLCISSWYRFSTELGVEKCSGTSFPRSFRSCLLVAAGCSPWDLGIP